MFQSNKTCFITLNKKKGYSSASSLNRLKSLLKIKKCGFCGTLDPIAEGVLVVAVNKATKLIRMVTDLDKVYSGKMDLGFTSPSYDTETVVKSSGVTVNIAEIDFDGLKKKFTGELEQKPPVYSALKVNGQRAYELARKGESVDLKPRKVTIRDLDISVVSSNTLAFKVTCSKGTYIRSLVNDIGIETGFGAVMTELVREKVGEFSIKNSVTIDEVKENPGIIEEKGVMTIDDFLKEYPSFELSDKEYGYFRNGSDISKSGISFSQGLTSLKYCGETLFLIKKDGEELSYFAFLGSGND